MAQSSTYRNPCQNPHNNKDKLTGRTPTKDSNRCTPAPAATRALTPATVSFIAPLGAFGSADSSVVRYFEDDLHQILRTVLNSRSLVPIPAPVVAAAPHSKGSRERPLKAWFSNIYWGKPHLECYNFFQQCEDHFATAVALDLIEFRLRLLSWKIPLCSDSSNTSVK